MANEDMDRGVVVPILEERARIAEVWPAEESMPDGTRHGGGHLVQLAHARQMVEIAARERRVTHALVFEEEVLEVLTEEDPLKLRLELVQVAACCVRWIQDLETREAQQARAAAVAGEAP